MLPIAYCADCYQESGHKLYAAQEVAGQLGIDRTRVTQLARARGLGLPVGAQGMRLYTAAMVDAMRERVPGRPRSASPG